MGIVNKRNAVLGWMTWNVGKRVARKKAKAAVPAIEGGRPNKPAVGLAAGLATLGGVLFFWRRKKSGGGEGSTGGGGEGSIGGGGTV
jgi:LPXTG-motif cell wall-anchored protein